MFFIFLNAFHLNLFCLVLFCLIVCLCVCVCGHKAHIQLLCRVCMRVTEIFTYSFAVRVRITDGGTAQDGFSRSFAKVRKSRLMTHATRKVKGRCDPHTWCNAVISGHNVVSPSHDGFAEEMFIRVMVYRARISEQFISLMLFLSWCLACCAR